MKLRSAVRWRVPVAQLGLLAVLAGTAGLAFLRLLPADRIAVPVVLAAIGAVAISGLDGQPGPRTLGGRIAWSAVGFVVVATVTVLQSTSWHLLPTLATFRALEDALVNGVTRLLTSAEPAPAVASSLVLPVAVTWVVAFVGVEVATRRRAALAPAIPAVVAFAAVLLLGGPDALLGPTAVLVGAAATLGVVRTRRVGAGLAATATAIAAVCVIAVAAAVAGSVVPLGSHPFDLHDEAGRSPTRQPEVGPLARMQGRLLDKANPTMFEVHVPDGEVDRAPNWRLAELDRFDGSQWSTSATALPAGTDLPPSPDGPESSPVSATTLHQQVTLRALDGSWLPAAARPNHVSLPGVYVSPPSGTLSLLDGTRPDLAYAVVSQVPQLTPTQLDAASVDDGAGAGADDLPAGSTAAVDAITRQAAGVVTGHSGTPFRELTALQAYLRGAPFAYKPSAPSGETYAQVADFLGRTHAGSAEQYAGAFCLLARSQHLPCRVAVGFRRGTPKGGTFTVRSVDAFAWPEVPFRGMGWVAFDPTPKGGSAVAPTVADLASPDPSFDPPTSTPATGGADGSNGSTAGPAPAAATASTTADLIAVAAAVVVVLLLLGPLLIVALKARRRRHRLAASTPTARVLGAWQQAAEELDRLATGEPLTVQEVVAASTLQYGPELGAPLAELGSLTNLALFDRQGPTDQQSGVAWSCADELARIAAAGRSRRSRAWRRIDPRPLWRRPPR